MTLMYCAFLRILEDENEEPLPIPKTQMLAINVWPTTHKVRRQKNKSLQQLCLCSRSRCEDERSRLEQPSKAIIPLPPQQQNMTMQLVCHEKLLESPETAEQENEEP